MPIGPALPIPRVTKRPGFRYSVPASLKMSSGWAIVPVLHSLQISYSDRFRTDNSTLVKALHFASFESTLFAQDSNCPFSDS